MTQVAAVPPPLPMTGWKDACATLHLWTQIVGKIRMGRTPLVNHWWNVTLYVDARGLTTSPMPHGGGAIQIDFDFVDHMLVVRTSAGATRCVPLFSRSVAEFHAEVLAVLRSLGVEVRMRPVPDELSDPIPFAEDRKHATYDPEFANRFWRALLWSDGVMNEFRGRYVGKCSPVHFFWGAFDLAVTRFSGRRAPAPPDAGPIEREAYSHEVVSAGFWPGGDGVDEPMYYAYASPRPDGLERERIRPSAAFHHDGLGQFLLPYEAVRTATDPRATLLDFLQSTYEAGAKLLRWDRASLERSAT